MLRIITKNIVNAFKQQDTRPMLGRWSLDHTESMAYKKVDMTNEDHCGICDRMRLDYIKKENTNKKVMNTQ